MSTRLISDIRHTMRRWRRRPAFTITSVITLALGIGATSAIFSVIDAVLLQPLPWPEPHRLVAIHAVEPERLHRDRGDLDAVAQHRDRGLGAVRPDSPLGAG